MTGAAPLDSALHLRPGQAPPNIAGTRALLAPRIAAGQRASALPGLLARVFALCGDAHRIAARAAIAAARGAALAGATHEDAGRVLQRDTLREHLCRMGLDWPPALAGRAPATDDLARLRDSPLLDRRPGADAAPTAMRRWLADHALGIDPAAWLARWDEAPAAWLGEWASRQDVLPARLLHGCREAAQSAALHAPVALRLHADPAGLAACGAALAADPGFAARPRWGDGAAETGPWTRLNEAHPERMANAWLRLGARLAEAARLALPDAPGQSGAGWLRHGALRLADGSGLGWCEMARGLLVHRVALADPEAADPVVAQCDVIAPTEWNFHPQGPVARAIGVLAPTDHGRTRLIAAAFDPCVPVRIGTDYA